jgi:predicted nucleotidyltransferase
MPVRATDVTSESESELLQTGSTKKTYASKKRGAVASDSDVEEVVNEVNEPDETAEEGEEEQEQEEEYEIEKILDAKKGQFPGVSPFVVRRSP